MFQFLTFLARGIGRTTPGDSHSHLKTHGSTRDALGNLRPFFDRHWRKGAIGAVIVLLATLVSFPDPLIYRFLVDQVILGKDLALLAVAIGLLLLFQVLDMVLGAVERFYFAGFEQEVLLDIQQHLLDRTLRSPKSFFDAQEVGYLMSRLLTDVQGLRFFFSSTVVYIFTQVLRLLGGIGLLFYLEWRLAIVTLVLMPALVLCVRYFSTRLRAISHRSREQQAQVSQQVQESLATAQLIKAFSSEKRTLAGLVDQLQRARELVLEEASVSTVAVMAMNALPALARGIVILVGAIWVIRGEWTLGSLLAFESYLGFVYGPALYLAQANLQLQDALAALERVSALFDIAVEENLGTGQKVERLKGAVEFRNVSFAYDEREPTIEDISFSIAPGEQVAIVGPSGVGKTTLLSLLLRFYQPTTGQICFDGIPASEYDVQSLRQRIGYVPQNSLLLAGTIGENLRYGAPEASDEAVSRAARAAGIEDFITRLPEGYAARVGERGVNLSEGQKQRLSIARALVRDPDILVLDEPTAALDLVVEQSILDALPTLVHDKTLFVVAHRPATIERADRVLLLNEKRLVAMGTHAELLETNEYYRKLIEGKTL